MDVDFERNNLKNWSLHDPWIVMIKAVKVPIPFEVFFQWKTSGIFLKVLWFKVDSFHLYILEGEEVVWKKIFLKSDSFCWIYETEEIWKRKVSFILKLICTAPLWLVVIFSFNLC